MITEERWAIILDLLDRKRTVTVSELEEAVGASASTIRRDLGQLAALGRLRKVHGGAAALEVNFSVRELTMEEKTELNMREKEIIGRYAVSLIRPEDFVYIDAGTTTGMLVEFIDEKKAVFVTNSVMHARKLAHKGCRVFMTGGELKASTEALVGAMAVEDLRRYHFTKAFLGTNAVSFSAGFTTPDPSEAMVKKAAIEQAGQTYVLCDYSKFDQVAPVTFAAFSAASVITDSLRNREYARLGNVIEAETVA
ncbi:MAG: DeoR/GlpR family DNA-binding transcription regulator [bacterium]